MIKFCDKCKTEILLHPYLDSTYKCKKKCTKIDFTNNKVYYYHLPIFFKEEWFNLRNNVKDNWVEVIQYSTDNHIYLQDFSVDILSETGDLVKDKLYILQAILKSFP